MAKTSFECSLGIGWSHILNSVTNFCEISPLRKLLKLLWVNCLDVNLQILKNNEDIWSHCISSLIISQIIELQKNLTQFWMEIVQSLSPPRLGK